MKNKQILIIGVGNPDRGDDGAGRAVARALKDNVPEPWRIAECRGEGLDLIDTWNGADAVILIDAIASGREPGRLHRWDAAATPLPKEWFPTSTHGLGVAQSIELARSLNELPPTLIVYGIEAASFEAGAGLSPAVQNAIPRLIDRILQEEKGEIHA